VGDQGATTRSTWLRFTSVVALIALLVGGSLILIQVRSSRSADAQVAWLDDPASSALLTSLLLKPIPATSPRLGAPACTADKLPVLSVRPLGISQDDGFMILLRNTSSAACLLKGTPRVVANLPGKTTVRASKENLPSYGEVTDTAPGATVELEIDIPAACQAYPGGTSATFPEYQSLTISTSSGMSKVVHKPHLAFPCGMATTPFFTPKPALRYPKNPLVALIPRLRLPATVRAGFTLSYVVTLINAGGKPVALSPCPAYLENSSIPTKLVYRLNCQSVRTIPAHGQVTYQMEMAIPSTAPSGMTKVGWILFGASTLMGHGQLRVIK
jgi:hypothetical protein